jgi:hypothetical protein
MAQAKFEYAQAEEIRDVCRPDDIIESKRAANRAKDRESLPRLVAFRDYWKNRR